MNLKKKSLKKFNLRKTLQWATLFEGLIKQRRHDQREQHNFN